MASAATGEPVGRATMPNTDDLNRTVFISDNLPFLKSLDTESVDLVCIDPPFGKRQTFTGKLKPPLSDDELRAERELMDSWGCTDPDAAYALGVEYPDQTGRTANFGDIWDFSRLIYEDWLTGLEDEFPAAYWLIQATRYTHSDDNAAYIAFMVERMLEIRRILKPTGSVYLHCDYDANAYLRQMMDAVFGQDKFRNEIVWKRTGSHGGSNRWGSIHDTILFYSKSEQYTWNRVFQQYSEEYVDEYYKYKDEKGLYRLVTLTGAGVSSGESGQEWRGVNPTGSGRHWAVPLRSLQRAYPGEKLEKLSLQEKLDLLDDAGLVYWPKRGTVPQQKRYLDEGEGVPVQDIVLDINQLAANSKERAGYPAQKPQALARRIIEASSKPNEIVLDCFAGCAYVPVAAELAGRRWIACDMSPRAWTIVRRQFSKQPDLRIVTEGEYAEGEGVRPQLGDTRLIRVRGPHDLPQRTNEDAPVPMSAKTLPKIQFKQRPSESDEKIWQAFVGEWGTRCWYCGADKPANRRELQLDHIEPASRDGSNDDCWNRALACSPCNGDKANKLTPEQTVNLALENGRIPTKARRKEVLEGFHRRRQWAKERWEEVRPSKTA
jgi:DNA modification methylase/5-methylcytosine-specific restriction endonuclease McrA